MNYIVKPNYISQDDVDFIKSFQKPEISEINDHHIKTVNESVKGWSIMHDFSLTDISKEITQFQGDGTLIKDVPVYYKNLGHKIASDLGIKSDHMFFQYILIGSGGQVKKHYDVGKPGYITYKCNICVDGPEKDHIHVGNELMPVTPRGLYCFEANLYKHWMDTCDVPRIHLSYGFILEYSELGFKEESSIIKLSNKIWNLYMSKKVSY